MKKIMILGGGPNQIPLIKAAKKNGYYVVLCDYSEKAPGVALADELCLVSIMDLEGVVNAAKEQRVDGIFTNSEPAMQIATDAANRLGLPANPSSVIELLSSKAQFRKLQREHGFVVPASGVAANLVEALRSPATGGSKAAAIAVSCIVLLLGAIILFNSRRAVDVYVILIGVSFLVNGILEILAMATAKPSVVDMKE